MTGRMDAGNGAPWMRQVLGDRLGERSIDRAGRLRQGTDVADPTRLHAFARLQAFNAELLRASSATEVLGRWGAGGHPITARVLPGPARLLPVPLGDLLAAGPGEVRHRHVQLLCGSLVLSEADNWYRPDRLSEGANRALAETDMPFGRVVGPLGFRRVTLAARLLWHPARGRIPWHVLRHTAVLRDGEDVPFSVVVETYTADLLQR